MAGLLLLVVAGCGTPAAPGSAPPFAGTNEPPTPGLASPAPAPTPTPDGVEVTASAPGSPSDATVTRDDTLLAVLPPDIDGNEVTVEEQAFREAAADPAFAEHIDRAAFAIVVSPNDLASGVVAAPREGAFDDAFFRDWRETYTEGACEQAGGVATNAETTLGGRTVYVSTCAGGMLVYHASLEERGLIVSLFALGEGRYGERLVRGLRP